MSLPSGTAAKTFKLLSIGQRGVGKTVFLAGSYTELHSNKHPDDSQQLWFDCQDAQAEENIASILGYDEVIAKQKNNLNPWSAKQYCDMPNVTPKRQSSSFHRQRKRLLLL